MGSSLSYDVLAFSPDVISVNSQSDTDGENENDKPGYDYSYQIVKNVSQTLQVDFHPDLCFEFELPLVLDNTHGYHFYSQQESEEYFKTLFHFIISPNAP